ncbi:MAG: hypothetical protein K0Q83_3115 [Deltaproteobacteria bacterium]|jgi:hypothetical protein|nr:hypothetical protein [Deltaproteobacteria bacterium]
MEREEKRLEQFRQLRKEIRGSQNYLVVGIDISKDIHNASMRTTSGKTLYRLGVPTWAGTPWALTLIHSQPM